MSASNPKCHNKGCQCATCKVKCNFCNLYGRCSDKVCKSEHGKQNCEYYEREILTEYLS